MVVLRISAGVSLERGRILLREVLHLWLKWKISWVACAVCVVCKVLDLLCTCFLKWENDDNQMTWTMTDHRPMAHKGQGGMSRAAELPQKITFLVASFHAF